MGKQVQQPATALEMTSEAVGMRSKPFEVVVTPRSIMNYAAGVGDDNPWYFDDERPEGLIAPPMLSVALTWVITVNPEQYWPGRVAPPEVGGRGVHYTEFIEWHRPMKPGERLCITAEVKAVLPHRSGTHLITEFVAVDAQGVPVFTEYAGGLMRGVTCVDGGRGQDAVPQVPRYEAPDKPLWEQVVPISRLAAHVYDACADIHNPIHTSVAVAHRVNLPDIILHGTATLALACREITNREAGADPRRVKALRCNFTGMVLLGSEITVEVLGREQHSEKTDIHFCVSDINGKKAIRNGCMTVVH